MHADSQLIGNLLRQFSPAYQTQDFSLAAGQMRIFGHRERADLARPIMEQLTAHAVLRPLIGRNVQHAQRKPDIPRAVQLQHLKLLDDPHITPADIHPVFIDQLRIESQLFVFQYIPQTGDAVAVQFRPVVGVDAAHKIVRILGGDALQIVTEQLRKVVRREDVTAGIHIEDRDAAVRNLRQQRQLGNMTFQHRVVQLPGIEPLGVQQLLEFTLQCFHY